jgi:hypothetical protein
MNLIEEAIPKVPDDEAGHTLHYVLEAVEGVEVGLSIFGAHVAGLLGLGIEVAGPVAGAAAVFVALGTAHADAINSVIADETYSGFSRGMVLGADHRSPAYVKGHFVKWAPVPNTVYPEYGRKFQNAYNRALVAGFGQGQRLEKEQQRAFFSDLFGRMSVHPSVTYGADSKNWSDKTWTDYYIEVAAVFRRDHLK